MPRWTFLLVAVSTVALAACGHTAPPHAARTVPTHQIGFGSPVWQSVSVAGISFAYPPGWTVRHDFTCDGGTVYRLTPPESEVAPFQVPGPSGAGPLTYTVTIGSYGHKTCLQNRLVGDFPLNLVGNGDRLGSGALKGQSVLVNLGVTAVAPTLGVTVGSPDGKVVADGQVVIGGLPYSVAAQFTATFDKTPGVAGVPTKAFKASALYQATLGIFGSIDLRPSGS